MHKYLAGFSQAIPRSFSLNKRALLSFAMFSNARIHRVSPMKVITHHPDTQHGEIRRKGHCSISCIFDCIAFAGAAFSHELGHDDQGEVSATSSPDGSRGQPPAASTHSTHTRVASHNAGVRRWPRGSTHMHYLNHYNDTFLQHLGIPPTHPEGCMFCPLTKMWVKPVHTPKWIHTDHC